VLSNAPMAKRGVPSLAYLIMILMLKCQSQSSRAEILENLGRKGSMSISPAHGSVVVVVVVVVEDAPPIENSQTASDPRDLIILLAPFPFNPLI
jgi:hypothetical protein